MSRGLSVEWLMLRVNSQSWYAKSKLSGFGILCQSGWKVCCGPDWCCIISYQLRFMQQQEVVTNFVCTVPMREFQWQSVCSPACKIMRVGPRVKYVFRTTNPWQYSTLTYQPVMGGLAVNLYSVLFVLSVHWAVPVFRLSVQAIHLMVSSTSGVFCMKGKFDISSQSLIAVLPVHWRLVMFCVSGQSRLNSRGKSLVGGNARNRWALLPQVLGIKQHCSAQCVSVTRKRLW